MYWKVSVGLSVMFRTPRIDSLWNLTPSWAAPIASALKQG